MLLVYLSSLILLSTFLYWLIFFISTYCIQGVYPFPSTLRWIVTVLFPVIIATWGLRKKSIDKTGAAAGILVGFVLTLSNYCFLASLLAFFVFSSKATKYQARKKRKLEADFKEGGQRNWVQVICNGGAAAELALLYMIIVGIGERSIDFKNEFASSFLQIGVLSALAAANGDTLASELGSVLSKGDVRLITSFKKVPRGTNGGISLVGIVVSALGGTIIGIAYSITLSMTGIAVINSFMYLLIGTFAGLFGSLIDSVLGATVQYSGLDTKTGKIVEHSGPNIKHISGKAIVDNHSVNLLMSTITSLITPSLTALLWKYS